jgi:hypothetical protein
MTPDALRYSAHADAAPPPALAGPLVALWWDARGDWTRAHAAAQAGEDADSAWVHAYLHRREGDLANADYWYRRARRSRPATSLEAEWAAMVVALLPVSPR